MLLTHVYDHVAQPLDGEAVLIPWLYIPQGGDLEIIYYNPTGKGATLSYWTARPGSQSVGHTPPGEPLATNARAVPLASDGVANGGKGRRHFDSAPTWFGVSLTKTETGDANPLLEVDVINKSGGGR